MDPEPLQYRVDRLQAQLAAADAGVAELDQQLVESQANVKRVAAELEVTRIQYLQFKTAAEKSAISRLRVEQIEKDIKVLEAELESARAAERLTEIALESEVAGQNTTVAEVLAQLNEAKYNLNNTAIRAPSDGYVSNLQIYPGSFVRLKQPIMTFINSEDHWLIATVPQRGVQRLRTGDKAEIAFDMYPGKVFDAEIESVVWATGNSQGIPSGVLPHMNQVQGAQLYAVRMRIVSPDPDYPLRFGASGLAAMYSTDAAGFLLVLRKLELQSESFLNYIYNPFK
jgi:multidrug resistance efflux pump